MASGRWYARALRRRVTCEDDHPLSRATCPTPSADGQHLYVVCSCRHRKKVELEEWAEELQRQGIQEAIHDT